jgi:hypothetical protein
MKGKTNPRVRYTRPGNRAERYLYRGTNRYILLDEWKKRTACRIGKSKRSVYVLVDAMKILEDSTKELEINFRELVSGTLDLYFKTRMSRNFPIFYEYKRLLDVLIHEWYYSTVEYDIEKIKDEHDDELLIELLS